MPYISNVKTENMLYHRVQTVMNFQWSLFLNSTFPIDTWELCGFYNCSQGVGVLSKSLCYRKAECYI